MNGWRFRLPSLHARRLAAEAVEGAALALASVDYVHGGDGLAAGSKFERERAGERDTLQEREGYHAATVRRLPSISGHVASRAWRCARN
jgi:hypothetical protein